MSEPLRELLALFDINVDSDELEKADKKIDGFKDKLLTVAKFVGEAFAVDAVKEFVESQVEAATELERTAQRLGLTTAELEQYNLAAGLAGVHSEEMATGLRFLSRNIGEAITKGGDAAATFARLHVELKNGDGTTRGTGEVLEQLADHFKDIQDPAKRTQIAMELFGRQGAALIPILNKGSEAFAEARKEMDELGGPTADAVIEGSKKIEEQQVRLNFALGSLKSTVALQLFPAFEKFISLGTEVVKHVLDLTSHTNVLTTGMEALGAVAAYKAASGLGTLLKTFGLLKPSILETAGALLEFALPIIVIGGLYLIFDDLYTLMKGGQSVIGQTLDQLFGFGTATKAVLYLNAALEDLIDLLKGAWGAAKNTVGAVTDTAVDLSKAFGDYTLGNFAAGDKDVDSIGTDVGARSKAVDKAARGTGGSSHIENLMAMLGAGVDPESLLRGQNDPRLQGTTREPTSITRHELMGHVREPVSASFGPGPGHAGGNVVHQIVNNKIDVHTSSDQPRAVGEATGQGVATASERATSNALRAVKKT